MHLHVLGGVARLFGGRVLQGGRQWEGFAGRVLAVFGGVLFACGRGALLTARQPYRCSTYPLPLSQEQGLSTVCYHGSMAPAQRKAAMADFAGEHVLGRAGWGRVG